METSHHDKNGAKPKSQKSRIIKKNKMKKNNSNNRMILSVIFCIIMLSMTACVNNGNKDSADNKQYEIVIKEAYDTLVVHNDSTGKDEMKIITVKDTIIVEKDK